MKIEWVFVQDLYPQNPVIDRECDPRITVPVVRVEDVAVLLEQCREKLRLYRKQHTGEYVGGVEYTLLDKQLEQLLISLKEGT